MFPLLWVLLGGGVGASAALLVKRGVDAPLWLFPGQVWTLVAVVRPTRPWAEISKGDVARATRAALAGIGLTPIDAFWSGDYQLTVAVSVAKTTDVKPNTVLAIGSEWADRATLTRINQAPAAAPGAIKFP